MFCRDIPVSSSTCFVFKPAPPLHLYYLACALKKETMVFLLASRRGNTLPEYGDILRYITGIQSSVFRVFQEKSQSVQPSGCAPLPAGSCYAARFRSASSRSRAALPAVRLTPCSSIPLRFISLTGCALCKKKRRGPHSCEHDEVLFFSSCAWLEPSLQICSSILV